MYLSQMLYTKNMFLDLSSLQHLRQPCSPWMNKKKTTYHLKSRKIQICNYVVLRKVITV